MGWIGLILGFSGLIFVHELGHFLLAKWNGVRVYVFSLGMGPYLVSFTWRGTVYVLSMIPIGGYVKMAGQDDMNPSLEPSKDPHDYRNKRPGQRAAILAAGAVFNLIFTVAAFTFCYYQGLEIDPPRIGFIMPGKPLDKAVIYGDGTPAKLEPGDRIEAVNGVRVKTMMEAVLEIAGSRRDDDILLRVSRQKQSPGIVYVTVRPEREKRIHAPGIGLESYRVKQELPLGFTTKDSVVVASDPAEEDKDKEEEKKGAAAKAGIFRKGDEIQSVGGRLITRQEDMYNAGPLSNGKPVKFVWLRDDKPMEHELTAEKDEDGVYKFGLKTMLKRQVGTLAEDCEAARKGLKKDDFVFGVAATETEWAGDMPGIRIWKTGELHYAKKWDAKDADILKMTLAIPGPDSKLAVFTQETAAAEKFRCVGGIGEAVSMAWNDTIHFSRGVFTVLRGLIMRDVGPKALTGPIGMGYIIKDVASSQPLLKFLWFLGYISLNLGVLQFVPIPLLDGWHLLMVFIEKIKGSPVPVKVQEAFQYAGIFLIGGLLLMVTFNDISRFFFNLG